MSGLLDTDFIQDLFGSVFGEVYSEGELIRVSMVRQPSGSLVATESAPVAVKVQVDVCTEAMRLAPNYSDTDVRLLVLQAGIAGGDITTDDIIRAKDRNGVLKRWKVAGQVTQDPGRSYWEARGVQQGDRA